MKNFEGKCSNKSFKFIKVGANDGLKTDPFGKLILNSKNWSGALIEPVPYLFDKLKKNYSSKRFSLHQIAISNHNRSTILYSLDTDQFKNDKQDSKFYKDWMDGISSIDKEHIKKHINKKFYKYIKELKVKVQTLEQFIEYEFIFKPNLVHIDTEGHDLVVLESLNLSINKPNTLLIEHAHLSENSKIKLHQILKKNKYFIIRSNWDTFAILNFVGFITIYFLSLFQTIANYLIRKFLNIKLLSKILK